jgi:hypothetical protein
MDENTGLGTPNFFGAAWDAEQNDYSSTGAYQSSIGNCATYKPKFQQEQAKNNQLDCFLTYQDQFDNYSALLSKYPPHIPRSVTKIVVAS